MKAASGTFIGIPENQLTIIPHRVTSLRWSCLRDSSISTLTLEAAHSGSGHQTDDLTTATGTRLTSSGTGEPEHFGSTMRVTISRRRVSGRLSHRTLDLLGDVSLYL